MTAVEKSSLLPDWLTRCAESAPERLAVQCGQVRWSFAGLARQADRLARQLATAGVGPGSRVALLASNGLACVACVHALTRLGAVLVPLNTRLAAAELRWQIEDVRAMLLLSDTSMADLAGELDIALPRALVLTRSATGEGAEIVLLAQQGSSYAEREVSLRTLIDLDATQAIIYTSGTTARPKGVLITYGMQWWNAVGSALNLGHQPADRWLACLPLFHIGGLSILMRSIIYEIGVILLEKFDEHAVNRAIEREGVTIISVVAVMLQRMLAASGCSEGRVYPPTLRCVLLGGGPAPRSLLERCASLHLPVVQTYGLTESCSQAVTIAPSAALRKPGSAGRPLLPLQLRVLHNGRPVAAGEAGTIYLRGPTITPGYADHPAATAEAFQDGWFCTGDLGYLDADGYLYVLDRRSDLIISGGENVYPAEIESVLLAHPSVAEAGVCAQSDPRWGQVPLAFVVLHPNCSLTSEALLAHVRRHLAGYKVPRQVIFVKALPRNASGKLLRRELLRLLVE